MRVRSMVAKGALALAVLALQSTGWAQPQTTYTAVISVYDGSTFLGYAAPDTNYWTPLLTSDKNSALVVGFTLNGTSGTQVNLTSQNDNRGAYFGPVQGRDSTSDDIGTGSYNYLYLDPISTTTAAGATPQSDASYFSTSSGLDKKAETAVWNVDTTALTLSLQWINTDSSTPSTVTFIQSNHLYAGGDASAFHSRFPAPVTSVTLHLEILTQAQATYLSVSKSHTGMFLAGSTAEWDITVSNASGSTATSSTTTVSDTLPTGFTVNNFSTTDASWTCSGANSGTASCSS
jgi:uncharacterized repeat protein (TIGR01451 family)